jgi:YbgC/YbaW family acyl-CoA thioester hydrolase
MPGLHCGAVLVWRLEDMKRQDFRFAERMRVRWAEVDMQKIVFNGHYLMYFDTAVGGYWRSLALPYEETMHALGGDMFVKKASVEYHASARFDDQLDVCLRTARIGNSSMLLEGGVFLGDKLLVSGELLYVYANPATHKSQPIPPELRAIFDAFEAREAMTTLELGDWPSLQAGCRAVREEVFMQEQGIAEADEWDEMDAQCVHALVKNRLGVPVATGRRLPAKDGVAKIGRMAVKKVLRGEGLGAQVLHALIQESRERGDKAIELSAQCSAEAFYRVMGFQVVGEPYDEVGIAHVAMRKPI